MADINKPYSYIESLPSKFDDKDTIDQIRFQVSRNNVKQPKHKSKKNVFNPMAILLSDPVLGAHAWVRKAKYNKKSNRFEQWEVVNPDTVRKTMRLRRKLK